MENPENVIKKALPCPFCGGSPFLNKTSLMGFYYVACSNCGIEQPFLYETAEEAVKVWNQRFNAESSIKENC